MGYSATVPISRSLHAKTLAFMQGQYRNFGKILKEPNYIPYVSEIMDGQNTSYDNKKYRIGFDYGPIDMEERHYTFCILRWMALTFGQKRKFKESDRRYPYYVYDGYDKVPVLIGDDYKERPKEWHGYTEAQSDGWQLWFFYMRPRGLRLTAKMKEQRRKDFIEIYSKTPEDMEKIIREELARLTSEWIKIC